MFICFVNLWDVSTFIVLAVSLFPVFLALSVFVLPNVTVPVFLSAALAITAAVSPLSPIAVMALRTPSFTSILYRTIVTVLCSYFCIACIRSTYIICVNNIRFMNIIISRLPFVMECILASTLAIPIPLSFLLLRRYIIYSRTIVNDFNNNFTVLMIFIYINSSALFICTYSMADSIFNKRLY